MKSKLHIIFLLSLLAISKIGYADNVQNIRYDNIVFKHIGIQQGLSHNTVNSIVQDNNGFMWFGTRNGLCRYDGYSIATYRHIKGDTTSINHNFTSQLYSDKRRGVIWVSNQQGVASYNIKRDCFTTYDTDVDIRNCVFLETIDGEILIGGNGGILKYDEELNAFKRYLSEASGYKMVNSIMQDESGLLWILSNQSLSCYNPTFDRTELLPSSLQSIKRRCRAMYSLSNRYILLVVDSGIILYDTTDDILSTLVSNSEYQQVRCAELDAVGNIWIGTEDGIFIYDKEATQLAHYRQSRLDTSGLNDSPTYSIYRDESDNMWIGTYFGGVNYFLAGSDAFHQLSFGYTKKHLSGKVVRNIINTPNDGLLFATEDGGLNYMDNNHKGTSKN